MLSTRTRIFPLLRQVLTHQARNQKTINTPLKTLNDSTRSNSTLTTILSENHTNCTAANYFTPVRHKGKTSKKTQRKHEESDSEKESDFEDDVVDKSTKVVNVRVGSLRLDGIIKAALGTARNKIEVLFYESKIRVNGEKVTKKSVSVQVGDEIDVIKGFSPSNNKFLVVARVEVLSAAGDDDLITLKVKRCKTLMIENYEVPYKGSSSG